MRADFREALMRAYVIGWFDGQREGDKSDDGKYAAADTVAAQFPAITDRESGLRELREACKKALRIHGAAQHEGAADALGQSSRTTTAQCDAIEAELRSALSLLPRVVEGMKLRMEHGHGVDCDKLRSHRTWATSRCTCGHALLIDLIHECEEVLTP